jgi:hypothetical protein
MTMQEAMTSPFAAWESFYVIVGSSGAALTGLQFVVIALVAETRRLKSSESVAAFGTPTIVHFCVVLLTAAVFSAPWRSLTSPGLILGLTGAAGVAYIAIVTGRARRQSVYTPVLEDWIWHSILPFVAYATILVGAIGITRQAASAPFAIGAMSLLLLFIGIHNAWDTVTFVTMQADAQPPAETPS